MKWISFFSLLFVTIFSGVAASAQQTVGGNICFGWYSLDQTNDRVVSGEIMNNQPVHSWVFEGQASSFVNIRLEVVGDTLDPFLYVTDQTTEQRIITSSSNEQTVNGRRVINIRNLVLGSDGLYTISVTRLGEARGSSTGGYNLSLEPGMETVLEDSRQDAPIYDSEVVRGQLLTDSSDAWYFDGTTRQQVTIVVHDVSETGASASFSVVLQAYANNTWTEQTTISSTQGEARLINYTLPSSARYAIVIQTTTSGLTYELTLAGAGGNRNNDLPCIQPPEQCPATSPIGTAGTPLINEVPVAGNITAASPVSVYQFTAFEDDEVIIQMQRTGGDLDTFLGLSDTRGNILVRDDGFDPSSSAIRGFPLPSDGCYFVYASRAGVADGTTEGTFTLTASGIPVDPSQVLPVPPTGVTFERDINLGETANGTITNEEWRIAFRFRADADGTFTATATRAGDGSMLTPSLALYDAQFDLLDQVTANFVGNASNPLTFTGRAGAYYFVVVQREGGASGMTSGDFTVNVIRSR